MKKQNKNICLSSFCYQEEPTENKAVPNLTLLLDFEALALF